MKRSAKKILSLFLCAMLCVALLPAAAFAENETAETEPVAAGLTQNAGLLPEEPAAKAPAPAEETSGTPAEPESAAEPEKTGADKVLTAFSSGEGAALAQEENGDYTITSFAELKDLAALTFTEYTAIFYEGTESFVFEEDLTLPENAQLVTSVDTIVPSGVTVTANGMLSVWAGTLYVEGTLVAKSDLDLQNIEVSGSLMTYGDIRIPGTGTIKGDENITFAEGTYGTGAFCISYDVGTIDAFKAAVQETNANKPNRHYSITLSSDDTITIEEELTLGDNTSFSVYCPLVIAEGGSLSLYSYMYVYEAITINGSLNNTEGIVIELWYSPSASLTLGETGSYSGAGEISINADISSPSEVLPGFDLSRFNVCGGQEEGWWSLRPKRSLADGPDEYGNYYVADFAELKTLSALTFTEYTAIFYEGTESFVFEEDLTLPENTHFITQVDIIVPSGVTVTANGTLSLWAGTLYVEGTLVAKNDIDLQNIDVSGSLTTHSNIWIPGTGTIKGDENITFAEGNYGTAAFCISYDVGTIDAFKAAVQEANANKPNRNYFITLSSDDTVTVEEELTLGANTTFSVYSPLVIAEGGSLSLCSFMNVDEAITINGSLNNTECIFIELWDSSSRASLTLGETGSYSGAGIIMINGDISSPSEVLPGFDLSRFNVYGGQQEGWWSLRLKRSLADGPDEYGNYYVADFAELKQISEREFTEYTDVSYEGPEEFVFEEDLTVPENLNFMSSCADIRIPSGVTVTVNGMLTCLGDMLAVEGTLIANGDFYVGMNINVSGSMQCNARIWINSDGEIAGEENISFEKDACFVVYEWIFNPEDFDAALEEASLGKPNRVYQLNLNDGISVTIEGETTIPQNTDVVMFCGETITVAQGGTLNIEGALSCTSTFMDMGAGKGVNRLIVNGTLNNNGMIYVSAYEEASYNGELVMGETGSYSGTGAIQVYGDTLSSPDEVLPGFDLTAFDVTGSAEESWILTLKTGEETKPGDTNGDGKVNTMDLIRLMKSINGENVDMAEGAGDVNGDGKVNTMDLIRLMKYINGENVELK